MVITITSAFRDRKNMVLAVLNPMQKLRILSSVCSNMGSTWLEVM